jgi:hypothetical protein
MNAWPEKSEPIQTQSSRKAQTAKKTCERGEREGRGEREAGKGQKKLPDPRQGNCRHPKTLKAASSNQPTPAMGTEETHRLELQPCSPSLTSKMLKAPKTRGYRLMSSEGCIWGGRKVSPGAGSRVQEGSMWTRTNKTGKMPSNVGKASASLVGFIVVCLIVCGDKNLTR